MSAITPEATAKHIGALLGMNVVGKKAAPTDLKGALAVGIVEDEAKALCCVVQGDLPAAGSTGAALSRIPAGAVTDSLKKGTLEDGLMENFHEVVNVLTVLTTAQLGRRTILRSTLQGKAATDAAVTEFVSKAKTKIYVHLTVPGYAGGVLAFIL
jgi:hypothetical protein